MRELPRIQKEKLIKRLRNPLFYNNLSQMLEDHLPGSEPLVIKEVANFFGPISKIEFSAETEFKEWEEQTKHKDVFY